MSSGAPSPLLTLMEGRALFEIGALQTASPLLRLTGRGDRHPVLVLPGFTADDRSTAALRGLLRALSVYVHAHPDSVPARTFRERASQYRAVAEALVGDGRCIRVARPLETTEFLLCVVNSVCRDELLFDDVSPLRRRRRGVRALRDNLLHLVHSTLTSAPR